MLFSLIGRILDIYSIIIVIRVLSDWIPNSRNYQLVQFLIIITEPLLSRIRKILPRKNYKISRKKWNRTNSSNFKLKFDKIKRSS